MNTNYRWIVLSLLFVLSGAIAIWLNSGYGPMSSQGYQYALALVSACNRHDQARVERIVVQLRSEALPKQDYRVLLDIARVALSGDWERANSNGRELLKAQIRPADSN